MAASRRRFSVWFAAWLLIGSGIAIAESAQRKAHQATLEAMQAEALEETSPDSLRMASYLLGQAFNRGVDNLDSYAYLSKLVIQHTLGLAEREPHRAAEYRQAAVPMTYNLAVNTWVGWGPGEVGGVTAQHRRLGLEAARKNVELAAELGLGPERRRNGYWALGAQLLAAGDYSAAVEAFAISRDFGEQAKLPSAKLMAQGWIHVARLLAGTDEAQHAAELERVKEELRGLDDNDGAFYADQYAVALAALRDSAR